MIYVFFQVLKSFRTKTNTPSNLIQKSYETLNCLRHLNAFTFISSHHHLQNQVNHLKENVDSLQLPLHGIPVAIKDNFCIRGLPATCGSKMLQDFVPPYTATVVRKLIDAGAVIIGKTNMDEFGMGSDFNILAPRELIQS